MFFVVIIYLAIVYLLFFKLRLLPWNALTRGITLLVGVVIFVGFMVALKTRAPGSTLTEQARLAKLPRFSLNSSVGGSNTLGQTISTLSAGMVAPLYTGGALEAQLDIASADQ